MKKIISQLSRHLKLVALCLIFSSFLMPSANAQIIGGATLDDVVKAINNLHETVKDTVKKAITLIYEENPNQIPTMQANSGARVAAANVVNSADTTTASTIQTSLTAQDEKEMLELGSMETSNTYYPQTSALSFLGIKQGGVAQTSVSKGDSALNVNTLISPLAYSNFNFKDLSKNPAYNFIRLVSGLYEPPGITIVKQFNTLNDTQKKELQASPDYQRYQAALRAYIAAQSVGASNLYQILAERIPQKGLGTEAGMPVADASALQVQQYLATRRSQNKEWYLQMAQASPTTVARETLFTLAEIREQLFALQLQNERLLAVLSVQQFQGQQMSKSSLQLLGQKVQTQIDNAKGIKSNEIPNISIPGQ